MQDTQLEVLRQGSVGHLDCSAILRGYGITIEISVMFDGFYTRFQVGAREWEIQLTFQTHAHLFLHILVVPYIVIRVIVTHVERR